MVPLLIVAVVMVVYAAVSGPLDRRGVTSAMAFVVAGVVLGTAGLGWLDIEAESPVLETVTELALVFLLFSDAARIDLPALRRNITWPSRLLLIGLPLSMVAGFGIGLLVFPDLGLASVFLLATMLCSTDAALGQRVVDDPAVPSRVRQALDVESGLNDGLAVPFFLVALDVATASLEGGVTAAVITNIASQIGWGLLAGVVAGGIGGLLLRVAQQRGWMQGHWRQVATFAVALSAFAIAGTLGGSGFIAAFVGGMVFGLVSRRDEQPTTLLTDEAGNVLAAATWIGFGAVAISLVLTAITWQIVLYAVLSLTVVRMISVAIALAGTGARWQTTLFLGWFGPRGLASVVFALMVVDSGMPDAQPLLVTVVVTVALSVFLHGLSAMPLVSIYHRWYDSHLTRHSSAVEAKPTPMPRTRHTAVHRGRTPGAEQSVEGARR
ncbi:MAG: cation:proton antiporter [Microbacterium sp.]